MGNTKNKNGSRQVDSIHLIYVSIILGGVIVLLLALIFNNSSYAGELLNFAATLSSILLAVIAIVITLIDVAGQRNNIFDLKNSVGNLEKVSSEIEVMIENFNEQQKSNNENLTTIIKNFTEKQDEIKIVMDSLVGKIESLPSSDDNIREIKEEASKVKTIMKSSGGVLDYLEKRNLKIEGVISSNYTPYENTFSHLTGITAEKTSIIANDNWFLKLIK